MKRPPVGNLTIPLRQADLPAFVRPSMSLRSFPIGFAVCLLSCAVASRGRSPTARDGDRAVVDANPVAATRAVRGPVVIAEGDELAGVARPPVAKKVPTCRVVHGDRRVDDYGWLRDKSDPEVLAYVRAENEYTAAVMKPALALQDELYREVLGRIPQTDVSPPYRKGGYWYYTRVEQGKQYPIQCRKPGSLDAEEQVTLDLNALAEGRPFCSVHEQAVSDDGRLIAYTTDVTGAREFTLRVKDLGTGSILVDGVTKVRSLAWAADNATLFYVTEDAAKR